MSSFERAKLSWWQTHGCGEGNLISSISLYVLPRYVCTKQYWTGTHSTCKYYVHSSTNREEYSLIMRSKIINITGADFSDVKNVWIHHVTLKHVETIKKNCAEISKYHCVFILIVIDVFFMFVFYVLTFTVCVW